MSLEKMSGLCKGIVVDTDDPSGFHRIRVRIPELHGPIKQESYNNMTVGKTTYWTEDCDIPWAEVAYPFSADTIPEINQVVVVGFFNGDQTQPVVLGWLGYEYTKKENVYRLRNNSGL